MFIVALMRPEGMEIDQADDPSDTEVQNLRRRRVLVVEDDPDHAELLKDILLERHAIVSHSADGASCLAQDLARFDIILLDQNLPDSTGTDLLCEIVSRTDTPVIMVTSEDNYQLAVQAGASHAHVSLLIATLNLALVALTLCVAIGAIGPWTALVPSALLTLAALCYLRFRLGRKNGSPA